MVLLYTVLSRGSALHHFLSFFHLARVSLNPYILYVYYRITSLMQGISTNLSIFSLVKSLTKCAIFNLTIISDTLNIT